MRVYLYDRFKDKVSGSRSDTKPPDSLGLSKKKSLPSTTSESNQMRPAFNKGFSPRLVSCYHLSVARAYVKDRSKPEMVILQVLSISDFTKYSTGSPVCFFDGCTIRAFLLSCDGSIRLVYTTRSSSDSVQSLLLLALDQKHQLSILKYMTHAMCAKTVFFPEGSPYVKWCERRRLYILVHSSWFITRI